jgi:hypothetical protein
MIISNQTKELSIKIGYHGPCLGGKTTSIQYIYNLDSESKEKEVKSTYCDTYGHQLFCNTTLKEKYKGWKIKLCFAAKVGAIYLNEGNYKALENVDGIIFVADSQPERMDANINYLYFLDDIFQRFEYHWEQMPYALQLNKRDCPDVLSVEEMLKELQKFDKPFFESVAHKGIGIKETLCCVIQQIIQNNSL